MTRIPVIRESMFAGLMYPDDQNELTNLIASYFSGKPQPERCLRALVSPHAALTYAGPIMASAWSQICLKKTQKLVIIADLHPKTANTLFPGSRFGIVLTQADYFATPLGAVPVDQELCNEIEACSTIVAISDSAHEEEFGIELQTLFSVYLLPGVPIIPILIYGTNDISVQTLARSLDYLFPEPNTDTVFIASCNLGTGKNSTMADAQKKLYKDIIENNSINDFWQFFDNNNHHYYKSLSLGVLLSMKTLQRHKRNIIMTGDSAHIEHTSSPFIVNYGSAGWYDE